MTVSIRNQSTNQTILNDALGAEELLSTSWLSISTYHPL
jgi:hypothetical protein